MYADCSLPMTRVWSLAYIIICTYMYLFAFHHRKSFSRVEKHSNPVTLLVDTRSEFVMDGTRRGIGRALAALRDAVTET